MAATMAGGPAMAAGGIAAGAPALIFAPAPSVPCSALAARAAAYKFCLTPDAGNSQVSLTWTPSAAGINLTIYDGTTPGTGKPAQVSTVTDTSALVTGLTNGTTYYFWLVSGKIVVSNTVSAVPVTVPGAPAGLTATAGNARVTLSWAAPASDGGSPVSGYNVYAATSADFKGAAELPGVTGTAIVLVGLVNGTSYYFRVTAVNAVGQSPPSAGASATLPPIVPPPPPASTVPASTVPASTVPASTVPASTVPATASTSAPAFAAPTGLTATAGNTQVTLSWTAPASDGGSPVISYKIYIGTAPGVQGSRAIGSSKSTSATVTGLPNGTVYYFMVTAVNAAGNESPFSTEVSAEPAGSATGVTVSLNSSVTPTQLIGLLMAVGAMVAAGVLTLIARRRRRFRSRKLARSEPSRQQMAVASDVRAVPDTVRPEVVSVRDTGREPTHTVRLEPHPGVTTTTIKERRP